MLNKLKKMQAEKSSEKGFTIIEVMIVLAIAGLIILIVFLAVPALQRNSRNTQRKNDISNMVAAINEYTTNNSGVAPTSAATLTTALANNKYAYYNATPPAAYNAGALANPNNDTVTVAIGAKCSAGDAVAGSARAIALLYSIEANGGTNTKACQDS
jgi:prepilin-type N-terminal cleavage/methylation domain-containing protein